MVVDALGRIQIEAGIGRDVVETEIELEEEEEARKRMPLMKQRREDVYVLKEKEN